MLVEVEESEVFAEARNLRNEVRVLRLGLLDVEVDCVEVGGPSPLRLEENRVLTKAGAITVFEGRVLY